MTNQAIKTINLSPFFMATGLKAENFHIQETLGMYPYKETIETNWAYYTAFGFKKILQNYKEKNLVPANIAITGIGSGIEGIAAVKIFQPDLKNLSISDIDREIIEGAIKNISPSIHGLPINLIPLIGSFSETFHSLSFKQDLIYGNIPNLPATDSQNLIMGEDKGTFLLSKLYEKYNPPRKYSQWALGAQYAYLQSAKNILSSHGAVCTELGGRMPLEIIEELFTDCDLKMSEILVGFKEQTEALIDFEGYHKFEKEFGVEFDFYFYQESVNLMKQYGITNPTDAISGKKLKQLLEPFKINSGQALELYKQGIKIGHTVHIFQGTLL